MVVGGRELIDTLWNVNISSVKQCHIPVFELIDTLWNVNSIAFVLTVMLYHRINRYIMECKYSLISFRVHTYLRGINRYIMECKYVCLKS